MASRMRWEGHTGDFRLYPLEKAAFLKDAYQRASTAAWEPFYKGEKSKNSALEGDLGA